MFMPPAELTHAWKPRRVALYAASLLAAGYVAVFLADGAAPSAGIVRDAIANTAAAAIAALPVWWLCAHMPWRLGARWWFLPAHIAGAATFTLVWYVVIAAALGLATVLGGGAFRLQFLTGPALHWEAMTSVVLYVAIASGCYLLQAARDARTAQALQHESEMRALRAQLDPHLLFNTLHSLLELVRSGDARADEAIDRFARVTRYVSEGRSHTRDLVPLTAEWQMTQDYAALESLRLGTRLTCRFDLGTTPASVVIPAMSLQPLVENAIRHGIAPRPGPGTVEISARVDAERVHVQVQDDGLGAAAHARGDGTGLDLVRRRLIAHFGPAVSFAAGPRTDGAGWRVATSFPIAATVA